MRAGKTASILIACVAAATFAAGLSAHRRDELLQASRVALDLNRLDIELDLTPGIEVSDAIIAAADLDRDGRLSSDEQGSYCQQVAAAIRVEVDGGPLRLQPRACTFPGLTAIRNGEGTIQLRLGATVAPLSAGDHQVLFGNSFQPEISVYLANALVPPRDAVMVTGQRRDPEQRSLAIDYHVRPTQALPVPLLPLGVAAGAAVMFMFLARRELRRGEIRRPLVQTDRW